jgi:hypothetical protein
MMTTLVLILSGILIGAGVGIIWRDARRNARGAFISNRDARKDKPPEAEITISHRMPGKREPEAGQTANEHSFAFNELLQASAAATDDIDEPAPRRPALEKSWAALQPAIEAGIKSVNLVLRGIGASVGEPGERGWSYKNKGFGSFRRISIGSESVAWLRLEVSADGLLHATVKPHRDRWDHLGAACSKPVEGFDAVRASDLLSECLQPAATFAAQAMQTSRAGTSNGQAARDTRDDIFAAALRAANGALAQARASIVPLGPGSWDDQAQCHRTPFSIQVNGNEVARMHIDRHAHQLEVAVGVRDSHLANLGRRRRLPITGLTIHTLADVIASCVWPAVARFREKHQPA